MAAASTGALSFPGFSSPKMEDHRLPRLRTGTAPASSSSSRVFSPLQGSELFHPGVAGGAGAVQDGPISSDSAPACEAHGHRDSGRAGPVPEPTWSPCSVEAYKPGVPLSPGRVTLQLPGGTRHRTRLGGLARTWHCLEPPLLAPFPDLLPLRARPSNARHGPSIPYKTIGQVLPR